MQDLPRPPQASVAPLPQAAVSAGSTQVPADSPEAQAPVQASDSLTQASEAIDRAVAQTTHNPHARAQAIAAIKEAYIKARFGV